MIKIYQWCQHRVQKSTVTSNTEFENKLIILFKRDTAISPLLLSRSWERIELFREGSSVSTSLRHSERPDHRTEWNLMILEYSLSKKNSSNLPFYFEDQSKWKYKSTEKLLALHLFHSNTLQNSLAALTIWQEQPMTL